MTAPAPMRFRQPFPTAKQITAWRLRHEQGLPDASIAHLLSVSRESANRLIRRAEKRIADLKVVCGGDVTSLLQSLNRPR